MKGGVTAATVDSWLVIDKITLNWKKKNIFGRTTDKFKEWPLLIGQLQLKRNQKKKTTKIKPNVERS